MDQTADGREGRTARRGRNRQRLNRTEAQLRAAAAFMFTLVSSTTFSKTPARGPEPVLTAISRYGDQFQNLFGIFRLPER